MQSTSSGTILPYWKNFNSTYLVQLRRVEAAEHENLHGANVLDERAVGTELSADHIVEIRAGHVLAIAKGAAPPLSTEITVWFFN